MISEHDLEVRVAIVHAVGGREDPAVADQGAAAEGVGAALLESHLPGVLVLIGVLAADDAVESVALVAALAPWKRIIRLTVSCNSAAEKITCGGSLSRRISGKVRAHDMFDRSAPIWEVPVSTR